MKLYKVEFYSKDGVIFTDQLKEVDKHNNTEFHSLNHEPTTCAKKELYVKSICEKVPDNVTEKCFVKRCLVGGNIGQFIDPYGPMTNSNALSQVDTHSGRRYYEYVQVTAQVFDDYVKFLKTRNPAHFRQANREFLTGVKNGKK